MSDKISAELKKDRVLKKFKKDADSIDKQYEECKGFPIDSGQSSLIIFKKKENGTKYIFKEFKNKEEVDKHFLNELKISAYSEHQRIIKLEGFFERQDKEGKTKYTIIYPYYEKGDIYGRCIDGKFNPTEKTIIAAKIAEGILYMHENGYINRDVKPNNVLLDENNFPILCDFGFSRQDTDSLKTDNIGTPFYAAPEISEKDYTNKVDVYSYGMLLYCLLEKKHPNDREPKFKQNDEIMKALIKECIDREPERRPDMKNIYERFLYHEVYFKGTDFEEFDKKCALDTLSFKEVLPENSEDIKKRVLKKTKEFVKNKCKGSSLKYYKLSGEKLLELYKD